MAVVLAVMYAHQCLNATLVIDALVHARQGTAVPMYNMWHGWYLVRSREWT